MKKEINKNYWYLASMILLLLICFLSGYLLHEKADSKIKSMQPFYNLGYDHGATNLLRDICDDGLVTIQGQKIPLITLCKQ